MRDKYYPGIDFLKGAVIWLVIAGHVLQGELHESLARYLIYSFHVPLFLGISGFLTKESMLQNTRFLSLVRKYFFRMMLPWMLAWAVYFVVWNFQAVAGPKVDWFLMAKRFVFPGYHLWYIPALFFYLLVLWGMVRIRLTGALALALTFAAALVWLCWIAIIPVAPPDLSSGTGPLSDLILFFRKYDFIARIGAVYRPHYFCFVFLGFALRKFSMPKMTWWIAEVCAVALLIFRAVSFYRINPSTESLSFYMLSVGAIVACLGFFENRSDLRNRWMLWIGINSLPIYLWHVLVTHLADLLVSRQHHLGLWTLVVSIGMIGLMGAIFLGAKIAWIDRYVFGNRHLDARKPI